MRKILFLSIGIALAAIASLAQAPAGPPEPSPKEVVERLWAMATAGDLLTSDGWKRASGLVTRPGPPPSNKLILVVSNYYGVNRYMSRDSSAEVDMEFEDLGQIDSALRYTPPQKTRAAKTSFAYRLVSVPRRLVLYRPDGKILEEKQIPESKVWQIEGPLPPPWTTVNTAIRYVLETRDKTADPIIQKNADQTLAKLKKLH